MKLSIEKARGTGEECLIIEESYIMYPDGVIYNAKSANEVIPNWLFKFRDYILKNSNKMKNL